MKKTKLLTILSSLTVVSAVAAPLSSCAQKLKTFVITVVAGEHGSVNTTSLTVNIKTAWGEAKKNLEAKPEDGYHFKQWTKDGTSLDDSFVITENITVTAEFEKDEPKVFTVSTTGSSQGVTFSDLPSTVTEGQHIVATYSYDETMQLNESECDILVGTTSIKNKDWVKYKDKQILIPSFLITDNVTIKISIKYKSWHLDQTWPQIIAACSTYEQSDQGDAAKAAFLASFSATDKELKTLDDLAGCWTTVLINNITHIVRILEASHDSITNGNNKKAGLTFELMTLLSDSEGNSYTCEWDTTNSFDYENSIFMKNLNNTGTGTLKWFESDGITRSAETRSALEMLPSDLQANIKSVIKTVSKSTDSGATFVPTNYNAKLFPLTYSEIGWAPGESSHWNVEGSVYKFWDTERGSEIKIKKDYNGKAQYYWLTTPQTNDTNYVGYVNDKGNVNFTGIYTKRSVSFAFCI